MSNSAPLLERAIEAHKGGRFEDAEGAYRRVLELRPDDPDALNFFGMLQCQTARPAEAAELLRRSVEVDPANAHAWINLGNVLVTLEKDQEALQAFTKYTLSLHDALPI